MTGAAKYYVSNIFDKLGTRTALKAITLRIL
ncbi:hypothetical protein FHR56_003201 [Xanthomonas sacchari]|nr:hypothetical protein [Xanthomonas sp. F10]